MLTLTRKTEQSIIISPAVDLDPDMTVSELFEQSQIEIRFNKIRHGIFALIIKIRAPEPVVIHF